MPPKPPPGMHYVPRQSGAPKPPAPAAPAALLPPAAPALPAPGLAAPPAHFYPSDGPTVEDWMIDQMTGMPVLSEAHTFTAIQTFRLTDAATGADDPALRPTQMVIEHLTTATPVPGIGSAITFKAQDTTPTSLNIARLCAEITGVTPGAVDATMAFVVTHQGQECEVARCRGQLGMNATAAASGVYGYLGGQLWARGDFYACAPNEGGAGFGTLPVAGRTVTIQARQDTESPLVLLPHSATQTAGFLGVGASPPIDAAVYIHTHQTDLTMLRLHAELTNNVQFLQCQDNSSNVLFAVTETGFTEVSPVTTSADLLRLTAPAASIGLALEIIYTGVGNALTVAAPGAAATTHLRSLNDAGMALRATGYSPTQSAAIFQVETSAAAPLFKVEQPAGVALATCSGLMKTAGFAGAVTPKATTYPITGTDYFIPCDATLGGFTVTLPTAVGRAGQVFIIKKIDATGNAITIATTGAQSIDGGPGASISSQWVAISVLSDGANWLMI